MRLCTAGQSDTLGGSSSGLAEGEIGFGCIAARIHILVDVEVAELGAHHGVNNVFEVVMSAILALERRCPQPDGCCQHWMYVSTALSMSNARTNWL